MRQLIDEVHGGRFPGLYLLITGTSAFFDGPQGMHRLPPLMQRLHADFTTDPRFDNPRAVQIRLSGFDLKKLQRVGSRVRDVYATHCENAERILRLADPSETPAIRTAVLEKISRKSLGDLQAYVSLGAYICHILDDQGKAMTA